MSAGQLVVDTVFRASGSVAVYSSHPLSRCFRDIHTAGQHVLFSTDGWAQSARTDLGVAQDTTML